MPVQIVITSDSPQEAGLELLALTEALRGRQTAAPKPAPAPEPAPEPKEEPPAAKMNTKPRGGRPKKITKELEQGDEDRKEAAQGVPDTAQEKEISSDTVKAKLQELQRLMGPAKATSWFRGAFKVQKFSEIDPADYVTVVRTIEQRLTKLIEEQE